MGIKLLLQNTHLDDLSVNESETHGSYFLKKHTDSKIRGTQLGKMCVYVYVCMSADPQTNT